MNILLIGEKYSPNLGDGVIFDSVKHILYKNNNVLEMDLSSRTGYSISDKEQSAIIFKLKTQLRKIKIYHIISSKYRAIRMRRRLNRINCKKIDFIVLAGGQLFIDYFADSLYEIYRFSQDNNIKLIFNAIGLGVINKKNKKLIKKILSSKNMKGISIRDSFQKYEELITRKPTFSLDPVFELEVPNTSSWNNKKKEIIGVGIMDPSVYDQDYDIKYYIRLYKKIFDTLKKNNITFEVFTNGSREDDRFSKMIISSIDKTIEIAKRPNTPSELIELLGNYKTIISFRLHSHIIFASQGIKTMGFIWDQKIRDFSKTTNNEKYFLELTNQTANNIESTINSFINDKSKLQLKKSLIKTSDFLRKIINE